MPEFIGVEVVVVYSMVVVEDDNQEFRCRAVGNRNLIIIKGRELYRIFQFA